MDKLKLAHDWFISSINNGKHVTIEQAWCYADAMQAEAEKRNKAEAEQKRKEIREILNDANTFIEREGQHFDDVEEWQPDWSQAPEWANWWAMDGNGDSYWHSCVDEPFINKSIFEIANPQGHTFDAPSFNYQGNWKDSLRKRPQ